MWEDRTIAEMIAEGADAVTLGCPKCRVLRVTPLAGLTGRVCAETTLREIARRARCEACGSSPTYAEWSTRDYVRGQQWRALRDAASNEPWPPPRA